MKLRNTIKGKNKATNSLTIITKENVNYKLFVALFTETETGIPFPSTLLQKKRKSTEFTISTAGHLYMQQLAYFQNHTAASVKLAFTALLVSGQMIVLKLFSQYSQQ